jgi:hypothetical protein
MEPSGDPFASHRVRAVAPAQENSAENSLRMGNKSQVIGLLKSFPFLLHVDLVILREITVHLHDLFAGYEVRRRAGHPKNQGWGCRHLESRAKAEARLGLEVSTGWASPSSRGLCVATLWVQPRQQRYNDNNTLTSWACISTRGCKT